jgi:hypothetical protein
MMGGRRCRYNFQPDSKPDTEGQHSHQQVGDQTSLHGLTLFFAASPKQLVPTRRPSLWP